MNLENKKFLELRKLFMTQQLDKDKAYIQDILQACENCINFINQMTYEQFEKDLKTTSAVQHQILIIGEVVKRVSQKLRNDNPEIPWKAMAGMRDVLIHSYQSADFYEIWQTVRKAMPELILKLKKL